MQSMFLYYLVQYLCNRYRLGKNLQHTIKFSLQGPCNLILMILSLSYYNQQIIAIKQKQKTKSKQKI